MSLDTHATTGINPGDPTPAAIAAVCAEYRATWSQREHYVRAGQKVPIDLANAHDHETGMVQESAVITARISRE